MRGIKCRNLGKNHEIIAAHTPRPLSTIKVSFILKGGRDNAEANNLQVISDDSTEGASAWMQQHQKKLVGISAFISYNAYLAYAIYYHITVAQKDQWDWCEGLGFLLILTALAYLGTHLFLRSAGRFTLERQLFKFTSFSRFHFQFCIESSAALQAELFYNMSPEEKISSLFVLSCCHCYWCFFGF